MRPIECQACPKGKSHFQFTNRGLANMVKHLITKHDYTFLRATQAVIEFMTDKGREPVE